MLLRVMLLLSKTPVVKVQTLTRTEDPDSEPLGHVDPPVVGEFDQHFTLIPLSMPLSPPDELRRCPTIAWEPKRKMLLFGGDQRFILWVQENP